MGTRADFYVGRGPAAEWLGSIAYDGHPDATPEPACVATDEAGFRAAVEVILATDDNATRPNQGWPWPWEDSGLTDYAYAFEGGIVWASGFGRDWFKATEPDSETSDAAKVAVFPDMSARKNVTFGPRSGMLVFTVAADPPCAACGKPVAGCVCGDRP